MILLGQLKEDSALSSRICPRGVQRPAPFSLLVCLLMHLKRNISSNRSFLEAKKKLKMRGNIIMTHEPDPTHMQVTSCLNNPKMIICTDNGSSS